MLSKRSILWSNHFEKISFFKILGFWVKNDHCYHHKNRLFRSNLETKNISKVVIFEVQFWARPLHWNGKKCAARIHNLFTVPQFFATKEWFLYSKIFLLHATCVISAKNCSLFAQTSQNIFNLNWFQLLDFILCNILNGF